MNLPVTGQDYLSMKIVTPSLEKSPIDYTQTVFAVNKIDTRIDADGAQVFQLHFISPELLRNERVRISKSYKSTISNMVYDALNSAKYINTNKEIFLEATKGIRKIVVPNSHPFDFIKKLAREAESEEFNSPHYLFYENIFGIHFRSIESLYRQASIGSYHAGDLGFHMTQGGKIEEESKNECAGSCSRDISNDESAIILPCNHKYCVKCLTTWVDFFHFECGHCTGVRIPQEIINELKAEKN